MGLLTDLLGDGNGTYDRGVNSVSGHYFAAVAGSITTGEPGLDLLTAHPLEIGEAVTLDRIGIEVTTAAASSFCRLGVYDDNGAGAPGDLLLDAGQVDASTTGVKEVTISLQLPKGIVWLAHVNQGGTPTVRRHASSLSISGVGNATATTVSANTMSAVARTGVSAALPATFGPNAGGQTFAPRVIVRVA